MRLKIRLKNYKTDVDEIDERKYVKYSYMISKISYFIDLWMDEDDDVIDMFIRYIYQITKSNDFVVYFQRYKYQFENGETKKRKVW